MEGLLGEFQARVKQRTATPRKASKKKFDFLRRSPDLRNEAGPGGMVKAMSNESAESASPGVVEEPRPRSGKTPHQVMGDN